MNIIIYIGDYGVNIWIPKGENQRNVIQNVINESIKHLGLMVVRSVWEGKYSTD